MTQQVEQPTNQGLAGPARLAALAVGALGIVVYLCSFSSAFLLYLVQGQQLLMIGGLLVAAASIRRGLLIPGAVVAVVGGLAVLQAVLFGNSVAGLLGSFGGSSVSSSLPAILIVVLILALLEAAGAVLVVLFDLGVVKPPAPRQAAPQGYGPPPGYGQPGPQQPYGGYQGGYLQQPPPGYAAAPPQSPYSQPPSGFGQTPPPSTYGAHGWGDPAAQQPTGPQAQQPVTGSQPVAGPPSDATQTLTTGDNRPSTPPQQ